MKRHTLLIAGAACAIATSAFAQGRDTNGDGKTDKAEYLARLKANFEKDDANKDGFITFDEATVANLAAIARRAAQQSQ